MRNLAFDGGIVRNIEYRLHRSVLYDLRNTFYHYKNVRWVLKEIVANWCVFSTNLF